jgi:hypothetical protein
VESVAAAEEINSPAPAEVNAMEDPEPDAAAPPQDAAATSAADMERGVVPDDERMLAIASLGLDHDPDGLVINECGEAVAPDVYPVDMGGDVGRAILVVMKGGRTTTACYGDTGMKFFLLRQDGENYEIIASDHGHFAPMETEHEGVKDFAVGGPGMEFPVYEWNGKTFVSLRKIPDAEFPMATVN